MKLTPATPADLAALAALETLVFAHETYPSFFFRQAHDLWPDWLLVARNEDGGAIDGYILGARAAQPDRGWVLSAATHPDRRGRGIGRALLRRLLGGMVAVGLREAWLTVHPANPARYLYEQNGFALVAEEAAYFGPGEPRLVLRRGLEFSPEEILRTQRLVLRRITLEDAAFFVALLNTPGWLQFIGDRGVRTADDARAYIRRAAWASYAEHGFGLWLVARLDTGESIGTCGLMQRATLPHPDIGFAFLPEHAGRGYATEAAEATMEYARRSCGITRFAAVVQPDNAASLRLLHKLGLRPIGEYRHAPDSTALTLLERDLAG